MNCLSVSSLGGSPMSKGPCTPHSLCGVEARSQTQARGKESRQSTRLGRMHVLINIVAARGLSESQHSDAVPLGVLSGKILAVPPEDYTDVQRLPCQLQRPSSPDHRLKVGPSPGLHRQFRLVSTAHREGRGLERRARRLRQLQP